MAQKRNKSHTNKKLGQKSMESSTQEVKLGKSVIVGAFSVDQNNEFKSDMSALKYLRKIYWTTPKDIHLNLKEMYENMSNKRKEPNSHNYLGRLNNLTRFIQENPENFIKNRKVDAEFVCFRGALRYVLASFYCNQGWLIEAVKLKGTIYLALITKCIIEPINYLTIFENCVVTSDPKEDSTTELEQSASEFCVVMSREIDELKILFGAECDAIISDTHVDSLDDLRSSKLIEIKSRCDKPRHYMSYFKDYKKFHWWCQSSIASIDTIYLGKRDENDVVKIVENINVESLQNPEKSQKFWEKNVCLHRLREFLRNVQVDMEDVNDPRTVFRYEWKEGFTSNYKNQFPMFPDVCEDREFLTEEYISYINNLC